MDLNILVSELENKSNIKRDDILNLVDKKYLEMKDLITKEGAVYLVAKELGINLPENQSSRTPIKNISSGMRNIYFLGRIFKISKINEFTKSNGTTGRVSNIFIGDNTGIIRVPVWDEQVKLIEDGAVSIGEIVQINNGLARENVFGDVEISLGRFGGIIPIEDYIELPSTEELLKMVFNTSSERTDISNIVAGGNFEIKGNVVQIFKGNFLFEICTMCGNKIENHRCIEHGDITPSYALVLSFVLDDSTGDLRCVLFREAAEKICNVTAEQLSELDPEQRYKLLNEKIIGKGFLLAGRVKKNMIFDRLEMIVNDFKDINPLEESKRLVDEIELMVNG